jgi:hypothetical protein
MMCAIMTELGRSCAKHREDTVNDVSCVTRKVSHPMNAGSTTTFAPLHIISNLLDNEMGLEAYGETWSDNEVSRRSESTAWLIDPIVVL